MRSLVMKDVETSSEWSHVLGEAMIGELKGQKLELLVSDMVTWGAWKRLHPDTTVMNLPRTTMDFDSDFYSKPDQFVFGLIVRGEAYALPLPLLMSDPIRNFRAAKTPLRLGV